MKERYSGNILSHSYFLSETESVFREVFRPQKECFFLFPRKSDKSSWRFQAHYHNQLELFYSAESEGLCRVNSKEFKFEKGDCLLIPSGAIHDFDLISDNNEKDLFMLIDVDHIPGVPPQLFTEAVFMNPGLRTSEEIISTIKELYTLSKNKLKDESLLKRMSLFYYLLDLLNKVNSSNIVSNPDPRRNKIYKVLDFLKKSCNQNLSLEEIGKECAVSPWHLCRIFKEYTGMSVIEYRNFLRMEKAVVFLQEGNDVTETAYLCGYRSLSYFIKIFRQYYGNSPGRYLRAMFEKEDN